MKIIIKKTARNTKIAADNKRRETTGVIVAIKKSKNAAAHMPDEVVVSLEGEPKGRLLIVAGWTIATDGKDKAIKKWPLTRLKLNLGRIVDDWAEEIGKSWKLEIRPV